MMAIQVKQTAETSLELERSKIEVQLKMFSEQMNYRREKDRSCMRIPKLPKRMLARLAIMKQGEMVGCLAKSSSFLS